MMSSVNKVDAGKLAGQYLTFMLAGEQFGVNILKVREIRGWEEVSPLPDCEAYVKGVLDLRGEIVPIIDLRLRFRQSNVQYTPTTVIIVVSVEAAGRDMNVGLVVDSVSDVLEFGVSDVRDTPRIGQKIDNAYIDGIASVNNRMVVLLDVDRLVGSGLAALVEDGSNR